MRDGGHRARGDKDAGHTNAQVGNRPARRRAWRSARTDVVLLSGRGGGVRALRLVRAAAARVPRGRAGRPDRLRLEARKTSGFAVKIIVQTTTDRAVHAS